MVDFTFVRFVRVAAGVVVAIIGLAILFVVFDANTSNGIVSTVSEWARTLTSPFHHIFSASSHKGTVALNYGLAIVVYILLAGLLESLLAHSVLGARERPLPY